MTYTDSSGLFHDRRQDDREFDRKLVPTQPQADIRPEHEVEHGTETDPRMSVEEIIDSLRFPSAGEDGLIQFRRRDQDLCRHCQLPRLDGEHRGHLPERLPNGQRTPGVAHDVEDGRSRNAAGPRPTPRRDLD